MKQIFCAVALAIFTISVPANADIVGGAVTGGSAKTAGGIFVKLTVPLLNPFGPPDSVDKNNFQSPNLFGFDEDQNILLTAPLVTDVGETLIPAGTMVESQYIFFDPGPSERMIGTVNFDTDVLAIITSTGDLAASDFLANTGVNYLDPAHRGLEAGDSVTISGPQQIRFDTVASSPGDYVRVITADPPVATPEPSSVVLLTGMAGLLIVVSRKGLGRDGGEIRRETRAG